jgi:hypothetical protein
LKLIKQTQKILDSVGGDLKVIEKNLMKKKRIVTDLLRGVSP